jgi:hypothetical protein
MVVALTQRFLAFQIGAIVRLTWSMMILALLRNRNR